MPGWPPSRYPIHGVFPQIADNLMQSLDDVPSDQEIYNALLEMAPLKSPGWDAISFSDLLDANGNWDHEKLAAIFHSNVLSHILGVKCPDPSDSDDMIIWRWTPNGNFQLRFAYSLLTQSLWDPKNVL
ncbi:hypothetical protein V6N11_068888 [Hibiscus sabdariffa]|uniref:Uncharacterized protein n=1 Tax=Hibiscus sabdariffa TaxID=183260 RepID=A0ABR2PB24_9ROSI